MNAPATPRYSAAELAALLDMPAPTEEQATVIEAPLEPLLVVAGAGSGKTATMSQKVVYLVANGIVKPEEILGLTFTRKATAELAARVRARLEELELAQERRGEGAGSGPGAAGSAQEMASDDAPADAGEEPTISTYDSFAGSLVRDYGLHAGIDTDYSLLTDGRATMLVTEMVQDWEGELPFKSVDGLVSRVITMDQQLASNLLSVDEAEELMEDIAADFRAVAAVRGGKTLAGAPLEKMEKRLVVLDMVRRYREIKARDRLLTFADQTAIACDLIERESMAPVLAALRQRYKAVLLDEFQDTSVAQTRLLSALFRGNGVVAVGDPNQAIYGWRGASASALAGFHEHFGTWSGTEEERRQAALDHVLPLSIAWRNDPAILEVANKISASLRRPHSQPGDPEIEPVPVAKLRPRPGVEPQAGQVFGAFVQDQVAQAEAITAYLGERLSPTASLAVLVRSNGEGAFIAEYLEAHGLPCEFARPDGLLGIAEVRDVRALLRVAADPERGEAVMRLLTARGIGAAELRTLWQHAQSLARVRRSEDPQDDSEEEAPSATLADALEDLLRRDEAGQEQPPLAPGTLRQCVDLARQIRAVREARHLPLPDVVMAAERALGLDVAVLARLQRGLGRRALDHFIALAQNVWAELDQPTLENFLLWLDAVEDKERGTEAPAVEPQPGAIQILTMHASKGLEWDHVVVAGMTEKSFPGYDTKPKPDGSVAYTGWLGKEDEFPATLRQDSETLPPYPFATQDMTALVPKEIKGLLEDYKLAQGRHLIQQERCLAYVAVTRARHSVLMIGAHLPKQGKTPLPASRYLREVEGIVEPFGPGFQGLMELQELAGSEEIPNRAMTEGAKVLWPRQPRDYPENDPVRLEWEALRRGAERVEAKLAELTQTPAASKASSDAAASAATNEATSATPRTQRWAEDVELLLAERRRQREGELAVHIPAHVAATGLGALAHDPQAYALGLRRPIPPAPNTKARLGTLFHELIAEQLSEHAPLMSFGEVGEGDRVPESAREEFDAWMSTALGQKFLAEGYVLHEAEAARELPLGGTTVRCRMDAIFRRPDLDPTAPGAWLIVDWKTNARRREEPQQLSIYVHVWATAMGVPTEAVRAAYVYVAQPERSFEEISDAELVPLEAIESLLQAQA